MSSNAYEVKRKRHQSGSIRIHICGDIGVVESRPKGAKTSDNFPFCAVILENGELIISFHEKDLLVNL